jgi:hypothetical protein
VYTIEVHWGATTILHRDLTAADALATGRADIGLKAAGAQFSNQSWGTVLPFATAVGLAADDYFTNGLTIDFQANAAAGDTVTLRGFAVVRTP